MYAFFLAGRYMLSRAVSYLAMLAIMLAVGALIVVVSVMNGFLDETRNLVRGTMADIVVLPIQYQDRGDVASREDFERVARSLAAVKAVCSRLVRPAVTKVHGGSNLSLNDSIFAGYNQVVALGVDPAAEEGATDLRRYLTTLDDPSRAVADPERPFYLPRKEILDPALRNYDPPPLLVGEPRMEALGLRRGMALELVTVPDGETLGQQTIRSTTETFVIAGAFRTGNHEHDMAHVMVPRDAFRGWTGTRQELSEMYVTLSDPAGLDATAEALREAFSAAGLPSRVETWKERKAVYLGAVENERTILAFVLSLFVLLTCTITFSMLTMLVQEKTRDIGILSAMGAPAGGIGAIFALAGVFISGLGGLLGFVAGSLFAFNVDPIKTWLEATFGIEIFRKDVYAFTTIPSSVDMRLNLAIVVVTIAFSIVICSLPALRAARLDPVEALRHE